MSQRDRTAPQRGSGQAEAPVRDAPLGWLSVLYAAVAVPLVLGLEITASAMADPLATLVTLQPAWATRLGIAGLALAGTWFAWSLATLVQQGRRPTRSRGRLRLGIASAGGLGNAVGLLAAAITMALADGGLYAPGLGLRIPVESELPAAGAALLLVVGGAVALVATLSAWPLAPAERRRRLWWFADAAILGLTAYALAELPAQPPADDAQALGLPVVRHVITTVFVLRLLTRLMPLILDVIERIDFPMLVAARHLRSKKSGFLAAISVLSVLAVTVSSCALTTTLSVMGGFRQDLKRKILGNNAHVVVDRDHGTIEGWTALLDDTRAYGGVTGASPFAHGEVMISSAANLGTAVLHGIDPDTVASVSDLPQNMRSGGLQYLREPAKLLDVPPDRLSNPLMPLMPDLLPDTADDGASPKAATSAARGDGADAEIDTEALKARIAAMEEVLKQARKAVGGDGETEAPARDVLPGIIIGQELARSLRLYVGDEVNVVAPLGALGPQGLMPKSRPFRVAGVFYSGMYEYDMKYTYVTLPTAQRFLGMGDAISGIEIKVDTVDRAPAIADGLRGALPRDDLRVRDWQALNSRLFGALELEKLAMFIALGIAILVASFCIAGTLTLMVQEKGREVAILKAMGTPDRTVVGVFVIEGGLIGMLGASLGLFLGYMMCFAAEHFGIRMNPEVYYIDRLPVHIDATEFALTGVAAVLICLLITVYPALLASRLRPVEALRYE